MGAISKWRLHACEDGLSSLSFGVVSELVGAKCESYRFLLFWRAELHLRPTKTCNSRILRPAPGLNLQKPQARIKKILKNKK